MRTDTIDTLTSEFEVWVAEHGLGDLGDALELLMFGDLGPDRRAWLADFVARWDVAQAAADEEGTDQ